MATDPHSEVMEFPQGETELSAGLVLNPLLRDVEGLVSSKVIRIIYFLF